MESRKVLAFGGGKGGTGKSLLVAQFGILLALRGKRVLLVDADIQGANLHTYFGLEDPEWDVMDIFGEQKEISELVLPTGIPGLGLLAGLRDEAEEAPSREFLLSFVQRLRLVDADFILVDVGSGSTKWPTLLFEQADVGILVTSPDPVCVEKDYRFLRRVCYWRIYEQLDTYFPPKRGWLPVPWLAAIKRNDREKALLLKNALRKTPFLFLVNRCMSPDDRQLGEEMLAVCRRFFGIRGKALGTLDYDERLWFSGVRRRPIVLEYPDASWVENIRRVSLFLESFSQEISG